MAILHVKTAMIKTHERPWKFDKYVCRNKRYSKSGSLCGREVGIWSQVLGSTKFELKVGPSWNFRISIGCDNLKHFYFRLILIKTMRSTVLEV